MIYDTYRMGLIGWDFSTNINFMEYFVMVSFSTFTHEGVVRFESAFCIKFYLEKLSINYMYSYPIYSNYFIWDTCFTLRVLVLVKDQFSVDTGYVTVPYNGTHNYIPLKFVLTMKFSDMGLGKTLQSICIIAGDHHYRNERYKVLSSYIIRCIISPTCSCWNVIT